uniref:PlsC domain-containing protein n=1 Tax=Syphacia muris TaxID=451379 RepID=A0A0N5APW0_9BILA
MPESSVKNLSIYQKLLNNRPSPGTAVPDVFHSNLSRSVYSCPNCFSTSALSDPCNYINVLDIPKYGRIPVPQDADNSLPSRWLSDLRYTISTPLPHQYPNVSKKILSTERVRVVMEDVAGIEGLSITAIRKRATIIVNQMKAKISKIICKTIAYILFKVFRRIMSHLLVCPAQMEAVKRADKSGIPLVYLPLHRSHLDYLLITWTVWHWGIQLPHIASGDNLNLSGLGWVLRGAGAFFIRRRIGDEPAAAVDMLYRTILNSYMCEILRQKMPLEFFLEGTRSRFGKTLLPKNGLISSIVEAVQQVPVSFTYEQLAEDMFFEELMGKQKTRESVWGSVKGMWRSIGIGRCGAVRMHFGAPVLLSEYLKKLRSVYVNGSEQFSLNSKDDGCSYRELLPWHQGNPDSSLIRAIGSHVVYDAQLQASVSICSVVSTLLLCKYECPGRLQSLRADLRWFCDYLVYRGFDVLGWVNGEVTSEQLTLQRVLPILESSLLMDDNSFEVRACHVEILRLAYYKNAILPALSLTAVVALAFLSHRSAGQISDHLVIETSLLLCDLLQFEMIFCKPCENLKEKIAKEVDDLNTDCVNQFRVEVVLENNNSKVVSGEAENKLRFFANIIKPFLYSLYLMTDYLLSLQKPFEGRGIF